jgi:hypothetical protein
VIPARYTVLVVSALAWMNSGLAMAAAVPLSAQPSLVLDERPLADESALPEMRASIVDREGDEFIAKTEDGHEFRLPVEGAPADAKVGDELRLVPDLDTHTMNVFKADPEDGGQGDKPESQL